MGRPRLLITDLDNTLYDWVTFFALAFDAMVEGLVDVLEVDREQLLDEFKVVHERLGSSEHPYATFELPSVRERFPGASGSELAEALDLPLHRFNSARKSHLQLYPGVRETLEALDRAGIPVVGHTEAALPNAWYRLERLGIAAQFKHLYVLEGSPVHHPYPDRIRSNLTPDGVVRVVPRPERKPNPGLLLDICRREGVLPAEAVYVGDSLSRDITMAHDAGVVAVWARYGVQYDPRLWAILVRVTHWTPEDVEREKAIGQRKAEPDAIIDKFSEILPLFEGDGLAAPRPATEFDARQAAINET